MNNFRKILAALVVAVSGIAFAQHAAAQEAPDALVKRISQEVLGLVKADTEIQGGDQRRLLDLVDARILPHVDFPHMTALAAGRHWREATPEQQRQLVTDFRVLLVYTYSSAISQIKDQKVVFKPMRGDPTDTDVEVRSEVIQTRGEPIQLNYRLEKLASGWKIYDVNILGAWLVESYKGSFTSEISKGGIDGLIRVLSDKNKKLAASVARTSKPS
jgi:phospholipid transport system substrate-binding protein